MSDPCPYGQKDCPGGAQCVCALPRVNDLRVRLREAIELVKLHATTEHWTWIREVESELSDDVPREPAPRREQYEPGDYGTKCYEKALLEHSTRSVTTTGESNE